MKHPTPHAVVFPFPAQGHIGPMMAFSKKLAAKGFIVTFVNTEHNHQRMLESQSEEALNKAFDNLGIRLVSLPDGLPPNHERTASISELCKAFLDMKSVFRELIQRLLLESPPITCIISDILTPTSQDVANEFGIPRVAFATPSATTNVSIQMVSAGFRPATDLAPTGEAPLITCVPGAPPFKPTEITTFLQSYDPSDFMFYFMTHPFQRISEAVSIVMNTFDDLEQDAIDFLRTKHPNIYTIGPLVPDSFFSRSSEDSNDKVASLWREEYDCLRWLDTHRPASVLYVSFGSIAVLSPQQFEEFALGLEASQQPLLWVVRPDLMSGKSGIFPEGYIDRVKNRATFISWAPQLRVLTHPSVGGFLTHCGWNSTLESIAAGVPMLGWPYFADQMYDCRCIEDGWKIGLSFKADEDGIVPREEVEKKVRSLMEGEKGKELRAKARKYSDAARKALVEEGGSSRQNFELFIESLGINSQA